MGLPAVQISGDGLDLTDAIREYIDEKLTKYENIFEVATNIRVECSEHVAARGVDKDFKVEVLMNLPRTQARVEKKGADLYAAIDEATDVLVRKVKKYKDKLRQWEGKAPWKAIEPEEELEVEEPDEDDWYFTNYVPKVVRRKKIQNCTPMEEAEAIERMEMLGYDSFLFKNKEGLYCMIYKRKRGGYGIVEACENPELE
jgi:putative sigma-54 modulation protein